MYSIDYPIEKPIYAIIRYCNDLSYKENKSIILIFETLDQYQKWMKAVIGQPDNGLSWRTLYKKSDEGIPIGKLFR